MIKKVTITKVFRNDTKKDGTPYTYAKGANVGKNFTRIGIRTDKTGEDVYYTNAMPTDRAFNIAEGQSLLLSLTTSTSQDGSMEFKNFNFPTKKELAELAEQAVG